MGASSDRADESTGPGRLGSKAGQALSSGGATSMNAARTMGRGAGGWRQSTIPPLGDPESGSCFLTVTVVLGHDVRRDPAAM
jgi:hypothetical protein